MKRKTIKAVLSKVHREFVDSIKDDAVKELVRKNSIISGGCIVSMLLGEQVNDYDYYFTNKETVKAVADYYVNQFKELNPEKAIAPVVIEDGDRVRIRIQSAGVLSEGQESLPYQYFESVQDPTAASGYLDDVMDFVNDTESDDKPKHRPIFLTDNAVTLSGRIQLVIRFYGSPEQIHDNYDFVHAMSWWRSDDGFLELPPRALEAILTKELLYHGSKYPLASVIRTRKFIKRGWSVNAGQYLKMILQIGDLDLNDIKVLEDQLSGMDAAYFIQVLEAVKQKMEDDSDFKLSSAYLIEIIDRIY